MQKDTANLPPDEPENGIIINLDGNIRSGTLLLFNKQGHLLPDGEEGALLDGILKSVNLQRSDIAYLNIGDYPSLQWRDITLASEATRIIAFGVPQPLLPAGLFPGRIFHFNRRKCITAPSLAVLENNKAAKHQLWSLLRELYAL